MKRVEYHKGQIINGMPIIKEITKPNKKGRYFVFKCRCGNEFEALIGNVKKNTSSCGCFRKIQTSKNFKRHGDSKKNYLHSMWCDIKKRCHNKNSPNYKHYGGRGIKMHKPWVDDYVVFRDWILENIGDKPSKKHSVDRIDNNGNYEPNNLRWATGSEQRINRRILDCNTSGYTGITLNKASGTWKARVTYNGERVIVGSFKSKHWAVFARNRYIVENNLPHNIQQVNMEL